MAGNTLNPSLKTLEERVRLFGPVSLCAKPCLPLKTPLGEQCKGLLLNHRITAQTPLKELSTALEADHKSHRFHWLMDSKVVRSDTILGNLSLHVQRHPLRGSDIQRLNHELSLVLSRIENSITYADIDEIIARLERLIKRARSGEEISLINNAIASTEFFQEKVKTWQREGIHKLIEQRNPWLS
jgi:hypothetical protein